MDITCAWCGEPWEADYLRHEEGPLVYRKVLSGQGCPDRGYDQGPGDGPYREEQCRQLVFGGVTHDDPVEFL